MRAVAGDYCFSANAAVAYLSSGAINAALAWTQPTLLQPGQRLLNAF
jgi:hypothetical protein